MKRLLGTILMTLGTALGLVFLFIGVSNLFSQVLYGGLTAVNLAMDAVFLLPAAALLFFAARRGVTHSPRTMGIVLWVSAAIFLILGGWMVVRFASTFPQPSAGWLMSMASSRAHTLGEAALIDDALISQGRTVNAGMGALGLALSALLLWFARGLSKTKSGSD